MNEEKLNFSNAVSEIEKINAWFLSEEANLDEGLAKFRRGLTLIKKCRKRLKEVENEFSEVKKEFGAENNPKEKIPPPEEDFEESNMPF